MKQRLFRTGKGRIKPLVSEIEGISFRENPLDFFILLARYKFAARLIEPTDAVLDAGCGHGLGSVMLAEFAREVVGVDIDDELIVSCSRSYEEIENLSFERADLRDLASMERQFDAVVCMDVIEHFTREQGTGVVQNLAKVLNGSGMLVIGTPNIRSQEFASERRRISHPFEYDYAAFKGLLMEYFRRTFVFSMTDEVVSTGFSQLAWYFMGVCVK